MSAYYSRPITQWPVGVALAPNDVMLITDVTDIAPSHPSGLTKKYTVQQVQQYLQDNFIGSDIPTAQAAAQSNLNASYYNGPNNDGVGATLTNAGTLGAFTADGYTVPVGKSVLVPNQSLSYSNGVYIVTVAGDAGTPWVLTRADYFDGSPAGQIMQGDFIGILFGNTTPLSFWFLTSPTAANVGTDAITFQRQPNPIEFPWINQTTPTANLVANTGYTTNNGASEVTYTLPAVAPQGSLIQILGYSSGGYTIHQNSLQTIIMGDTQTTTGTGGSLTPDNYLFGLVLTCVVANTVFQVTSSTGPFTGV
jgi:hypothetical protein